MIMWTSTGLWKALERISKLQPKRSYVSRLKVKTA
jgi:hypothetical protein